jgi:hypothetical protein
MSMPLSATGIDVSGRVIVLHDLQGDLEAGGVPVPYGLTIAGPAQPIPLVPPPLGTTGPAPCVAGSKLFTYDAEGAPADLPPEAAAIVEAYTP